LFGLLKYLDSYFLLYINNFVFYPAFAPAIKSCKSYSYVFTFFYGLNPGLFIRFLPIVILRLKKIPPLSETALSADLTSAN